MISFTFFQCQYKPRDQGDILGLIGSGYAVGSLTNGGIEYPPAVPGTPVPVNGVWINEAYFKATNVTGSTYFGNSIAVSGDTMVVGSFRENSNQIGPTNGPTASADQSLFASGAVYVFRKVAGNWIQEAYLKASNPGMSDFFGTSVAISGNTVVVGAPMNGGSGSIYVFQRVGTVWSEQARLKASNWDAGDRFGSVVSIDGDVIVIGAEWENSSQNTVTNGTTASADNSLNDAGAAYIFRRNAGVWTQEAYLKAPNPGNGDYFGSAVSISGDTVVVGAYKEDSQAVTTNGTTASADNSKSESGAAYVFRRTAGIWGQEAFLKASNLDPNDQFGKTLSVSNNTIVIGAALEDSNVNTITNGATASPVNALAGSGAAYIFERTGVTWTQTAYLKAKNVQAGDQFGTAVAVEGNFIAVGAINESCGQSTVTYGPLVVWDERAPQSGAVYMFRKTDGRWGEYSYFKAPNAGNADLFGSGVSLSGTRIVVGAPQESSNQNTITNGPTASTDDSEYRSGAAYAFER
ncbi:FG-GAP repeat protein [Leptospira gomenensis]|nr:FG-GAP repeat protein [Leptospira gomenensis]